MTDSVLRQMASLADLDMPGLKKVWKELYDTEPPGFNRLYMIKRLSYRIQEIAYGGLSEETKAQIRRINDASMPQKKRNKDLPPPGTNLVREYQGVEHRVTILHDGFEYLNRKYASLSVIARVITGTQWSGPVFFGLKKGTS